MRSLYPRIVIGEHNYDVLVTVYMLTILNKQHFTRPYSIVGITVNITIITILRILHPRIRTLYPHKREVANKIA